MKPILTLERIENGEMILGRFHQGRIRLGALLRPISKHNTDPTGTCTAEVGPAVKLKGEKLSQRSTTGTLGECMMTMFEVLRDADDGPVGDNRQTDARKASQT